MKVKDLITALSKYEPEREVIISSDSEGNHYSPLSDLHKAYYEPYNTWSGEIWEESDKKLIEGKTVQLAVILYAIN